MEKENNFKKLFVLSLLSKNCFMINSLLFCMCIVKKSIMKVALCELYHILAVIAKANVQTRFL